MPATPGAPMASMTRSGPMGRPAARSTRAKCITFSAIRPCRGRVLPACTGRVPSGCRAPQPGGGGGAVVRLPPQPGRGNDFVPVGVGLVIVLDFVEPVDIIHHDS